MKRRIITVDGLAGSGKTAISKLLAEKTGFAHFNSGLLYRAVGYLALRTRTNPKDEGAVAGLLDKSTIELILEGGIPTLKINGEVSNRSGELHTPQVSESGSQAAQHPSVRSRLISLQREAYPGRNMVAEGRDMGSVVFPEAEIKFFVQADVGVRVTRRVAQLLEQNPNAQNRASIEKQIEIEILERDRRDMERAISPTKPAEDAIIVDNSALTLTDVVQSMYDAAHSRGVV